MKRNHCLWIIAVIFLQAACTEETLLVCNKISEALYKRNTAVVQREMEAMTADLVPMPTVDDELGHVDNLAKLIDRLNNCDCIQASLICYACVYSSPPQSEVQIIVQYQMLMDTVIMDLSTSNDRTLEYVRLHND